MNVFLDTNIILDLLLERDGYEDSARIFQLQEEGSICLCVSILTMVNAAYVYRKTVGQRLAVVNLKYLSALLEVLPMDNTMLQEAILREGEDFEDVLQAVCAAHHGCDYVVTRNPRHFVFKEGLFFKGKSLPQTITPAGFLDGKSAN